jgi:hypothetical protein
MSDELKPENEIVPGEFMTQIIINRPHGINFDNTALIAAYLENGFKNLVVKTNISVPLTQVDFSASSLVTKATSEIAFHSGVTTKTINFALSGAKNRLDTGSLAANTLYALYAIYDKEGDEIAGLGSLSFTAPTMPAGFTFKKLIGMVITKNATPQILPFYQIDNYLKYLSPGFANLFRLVNSTSFIDVNFGIATGSTTGIALSADFTVDYRGNAASLPFTTAAWRPKGYSTVTVGNQYSFNITALAASEEHSVHVRGVILDSSGVFQAGAINATDTVKWRLTGLTLNI